MKLYLKNELVLSWGTNPWKVQIHRDDLLPYSLRNKIYNINDNDLQDKDELSLRYAEISNVIMTCQMWCASSILSIDRDNAKFILKHYELDPHPNPLMQYEMALRCNRLSLIDSYWIKEDNESSTWDNINLYHNWNSDELFNVALFGSISKLRAISIYSPEMTTGGTFPKAWKRKDNEIRLYKSGSSSQLEVIVSNILDCFNVNKLDYKFDHDIKDTCYCKCLADTSYSIVSAAEVYSYCKNNKMDFLAYIEEHFAKDFYKMVQVDYLISNIDRHLRNWGFYMSNETGELIALHPLFDHNLAFYKELMEDDSIPSEVMRTVSYKDAAIIGYAKYPLKLIKPLEIEQGKNERYYNSLLDKMKILGIGYVVSGNRIYP